MSQFAYTVVTPTNLWDNAYTTDATSYRRSSPFARWKFTTDARRVTIFAWSTLHSYFPAYEHIDVWVNGAVYQVCTFAANGETDFVVDLPIGTKTVEIISGLQSLAGSVVYGTYIRNIYFSGCSSCSMVSPATPANQLLVYGDSIAVGANATYPTRQGWPMLLRLAGQPIAVEAWGWRALYQDAPDAAGRTALAAQLALYAPAKIWLAIGTNDYGLNLWTAANFEIGYADLLTKINMAFPAATIYCQTPIDRFPETANGLGDTLGAYRTAIANAASGKSYCTVVDGTGSAFPQDPADLDTDRTHPTTAGHARYAAAVAAVLGI